jgi:type IV secretory pathway TrbL component
MHHFGEVKHQPAGMLWTIIGVGVLTAALLWAYDRMLPAKPDEAAPI